MSITNENALIRSLFLQSPLEKKNVIQAIQAARGVDAEDIEIANSIIPKAGDYLSSAWLYSLIRADVSNDAARKEMSRQKAFFARLEVLLPGLLEYFKFESRGQAINALSCIDDCHADFEGITKGKRQDRTRREALEAIAEATRSLRNVIAALKPIQRFVDIEFESFFKIYNNRVQRDESVHYSFDQFLNQLAIALGCVEIAEHRAKNEDDYLFIATNQARTHVVEYAYTMCRYWNGPPLVTTPASQFAALCSLLYEIVSGIPDESLAGAINRYARSEDRKAADLHELEYGEDYEANVESDNFQSAKVKIRQALEKYDLCKKLFERDRLGSAAKLLLSLKMSEQIDFMKAAQEEYGPHLVWAHQIPQSHFEDTHKQIKAHEAKIRQMNIEIGRLRREGKTTDLT